ncbi:hypothetical protein GCM10022383_10760 [Microbacterium soli]|uniref:HTH arsR-type domain-containing protein n=2 Tax=Microbacterium soli TaxID=446075 RepID=A0ABP7N0M7_9MICO
MLKALANPLRRRILASFNRNPHSRAADIAAALGEPANKISFHLRVLADAGLIVESPEHARDGRDRVWTAVEVESLGVAGTGVPAADPVLADAVIRGLVEDHQALLQRVLADMPEYLRGEQTTGRGTFSTSHAVLTPAEFEALLHTIHRAIREAHDAHVKGAEGTRVYDIDILAASDDADPGVGRDPRLDR